MERVPRFIAAAMCGTLAALVLVALAAGSNRQVAATVTLQVALRGLGTVSVTPGAVGSNQNVSTCDKGEDANSCSFTYNKGDAVTLTASGDGGQDGVILEQPGLCRHDTLHDHARRRPDLDRGRLQSATARRAAVESGCGSCDDGPGR